VNATVNATLNATNTTNLSAASVPPAAAAKPKVTPGGCVRQCRRREIRDLSTDERRTYFGAVRKLQEGPAPTKYDTLVKIHIDAQDFSHNSAHFLPWHRGYVREYEKALQEVDPSICVPYYNSAYDSQAPENSPVWDDDFYGGNGGTGDCVGNGPFSGWRPYYPQPHCLQRKWIYGDNLGSFYSIESLNQVVAQNDDYNSFRENVEMVIHPIVHNNIGGDLAEMHSPNDPLFFSHHAYVDYVWSQWQRRQGGSFSGASSSGAAAHPSDDCQGLPYKVSDVLDHSKLCYSYDDIADEDTNQYIPPSTVPQPDKGQRPDKTYVEPIPDNDDDKYSSRDRKNLNIVRYADRIGEAWAAKNRYDITKLRSYEDKHREIVKKCNQIEGYVSPCALWKRPKLCAPLIKRKEKLCCDIPNYGRVNVDYSTDTDPYQAFSNVRKRVEYCSPNVELPADRYRDRLSQVVGKSAFDSMKEVLGEQDVSAANSVMEGAVKGVAMCLAAAFPIVMQNML
jgi:tyrosinase